VVGPEESLQAQTLAGLGQAEPVLPGDALLPFDHQACPHARSLSGVGDPYAPAAPRHLSEAERAVRALGLGLVLGVVLAVLGHRR
jgi:hypothetical protein